MTRVVTTRTTFTGGELDPRLLGRFDLRAYENGARRLRNVMIHPTGGISRRPGLAHLAELPGKGRLIPFEGPDGQLLLVLTDFRLDVFQDGVHVADALAEWSKDQLAGITWLQRERELLVCHPDVPPQRVFRDLDGFWVVRPFPWDETTEPTPRPFARYAPDEVALETDGTTGEVDVTVSHPVFVPEHMGVVIRKQNRQIRITNVLSPTVAEGLVIDDELVDAESTWIWDEAAFSAARGWPAAIAMHQNRLVLAGPRDHGNRIWFSKTGRHFDFDTGTGLDDEAIAFALDAPRSHAIRALFAGRHLQVFTTESEWIVHGAPLTPTSIQIQRQTAVGSHPVRQIPPRDVDGATLFCGASGREVREFLFTDTEQAYQAADLALLSRHLLQEPIDQDFDRARRLLLVVDAEGSVAALTIDRNSDVVAWSRLETAGKVRAVAATRGGTLMMVERGAGVRLERLDETLSVDAGIRQVHVDPVQQVTGLGHLEGAVVGVVADGRPVADLTVTGGAVELPIAAREIVVGLPFTHLVEPMPPAFAAGGGGQDPLWRPVRIAFRVLETQALRVDLGDGPLLLPQQEIGEGVLDTAPPPFTGDLVARAVGWRRGIDAPPWRLEQDDPLACTLLSVTLEAKVNA